MSRCEGVCERELADQLIRLAEMTRNLKGNGLDEGASTRLLVHAGKMIARGITPAEELLEKYFNEWDNSVGPIFDEYAY